VRLVVLLALSCCGRVRFDPRTDAPTGCDAADLDLVGCWRFDGDTLDGSSYHNDAASTGVTFGPGHDGSAAITDASTQLLIAESTSLDIPDTLTIAAWVNLAAYPAMVGYVFDNDHQYGISINTNGTFTVTIVKVGGALTVSTNSTHPIGLGAWHQIALRYDVAGTLDAILDGAVDTSIASGGTISVTGNLGSRIGGDAGPQLTPPLAASLDDVRIWRVAKPLDQLR